MLHADCSTFLRLYNLFKKKKVLNYTCIVAFTSFCKDVL